MTIHASIPQQPSAPSDPDTVNPDTGEDPDGTPAENPSGAVRAGSVTSGFDVHDRVVYRTRVGRIEQAVSGQYPFRVRFEDGSFGRFAADELQPASGRHATAA
jgi:hypothetical protein